MPRTYAVPFVCLFVCHIQNENDEMKQVHKYTGHGEQITQGTQTCEHFHFMF